MIDQSTERPSLSIAASIQWRQPAQPTRADQAMSYRGAGSRQVPARESSSLRGWAPEPARPGVNHQVRAPAPPQAQRRVLVPSSVNAYSRVAAVFSFRAAYRSSSGRS
jgi:hypothetical protein